MADFVTKAEAFNCLRFDTAPGGLDDQWLDIWIPIVTQSVLQWLKEDWRAYVAQRGPDGKAILDSSGNPIPIEDSNGDPIPKAVVKGAILLELENMNRNRSGEGTDNVVTPDAGYGYVLNKASTALLTPLRKPTVS